MPVRRPLNLEEELLECFEACGRVTEYLVGVVPAPLWHEPPPTRHGRTIAAMITHMHGVRKTFAKMGGAPVPAALDRFRVTPAQVYNAKSTAATS